MCESLNKTAKKTPPNLVHEFPKKRLQKSPKKEKHESQERQDEQRRIFYTNHERFILGLAYHPSSYPLDDLDLTLFLVLGKIKK